jgi:hypothetical protein
MPVNEIIGLIFFGAVFWAIARAVRAIRTAVSSAIGSDASANARQAVATARARAAARGGIVKLTPPPVPQPTRLQPRPPPPPPRPVSQQARPAAMPAHDHIVRDGASAALASPKSLFRGDTLLGAIVVSEALAPPVSLRQEAPR